MTRAQLIARITAIAHQYPVHVGCLGECTRETPTVFSSWWCHACDKSVPWQEVQEGRTHLTPEEAREILSAFVPDPPV